MMILKNKKILLTGGAGFLGQHVKAELIKRGAKKENIEIPRSKDCDLKSLAKVKKIVAGKDIIIHLAGLVGGIGFNSQNPGKMIYENLLMGLHLFEQSRLARVEKFVTVGTVCCYPKFTPIPFKEENLWNGYPEETNAPYGLAKKMLLVMSQAYRQQYGFNSIFLLPVNLYGPGDNFNINSSHVIPALIRKIAKALAKKQKIIYVWGTGKVSREFLYVKDCAKAVVLATEKYNKPDPINIGSGLEIKIGDLVQLIAKLMGYSGKIVWDKTKPDGQPRRCLDLSRALKEFNFRAKTDFETGLKKTINWYYKNYDKRRN
jgi:GDP-L-fucose synthase